VGIGLDCMIHLVALAAPIAAGPLEQSQDSRFAESHMRQSQVAGMDPAPEPAVVYSSLR
jgi:hypothetical protein